MNSLQQIQEVTHCIECKNICEDFGLNRSGESICYPCCGKLDNVEMKNSNIYTLYVSSANEKEASNWPGSFRIPIYHSHVGYHNMSGKRRDYWLCFDGSIWHGFNCSKDSELVNFRRTKQII